MKRLMLIFSLFLVLLLSCQAGAKIGKPTPKVTALLCTVDDTHFPGVAVVGGIIGRTKWVESEGAVGLMRKGARLSLYHLQIGAMGKVSLTGNGKTPPEHPGPGSAWGLFYEDYRITVDAGKEDAYAKAHSAQSSEKIPLLAAWVGQGRSPRWIIGRLSDPQNNIQRKTIINWLAGKGTPSDVIRNVEVEQIVRADINGDKQDEVFISFRGGDWSASDPKRRRFAYLVMRYLPPKSQRPNIAVIANDPMAVHSIAGFCDLDRDGRAEIITTCWGPDYAGSYLFRQVGNRFKSVEGWGLGE